MVPNLRSVRVFCYYSSRLSSFFLSTNLTSLEEYVLFLVFTVVPLKKILILILNLRFVSLSYFCPSSGLLFMDRDIKEDE